jgi:hypothetical protein
MNKRGNGLARIVKNATKLFVTRMTPTHSRTKSYFWSFSSIISSWRRTKVLDYSKHDTGIFCLSDVWIVPSKESWQSVKAVKAVRWFARVRFRALCSRDDARRVYQCVCDDGRDAATRHWYPNSKQHVIPGCIEQLADQLGATSCSHAPVYWCSYATGLPMVLFSVAVEQVGCCIVFY